MTDNPKLPRRRNKRSARRKRREENTMPENINRLEEFQERIRFERWYEANRMGLYTSYGNRLRMAIEDTARAAWFEGKASAQSAPLPSNDAKCDHSKCPHPTTAVCCVCGDFKVKTEPNAQAAGQKETQP